MTGLMDVGRVCVKTRGKEAGKKCVITELIDKKFVVIAGPGVKKRKCNIAHLEPTPKVIDVKDEKLIEKELKND